MLLDAGDIAHAVRRDAGGGLLHLDLGGALGLDLGEALGMEVDRAPLAALHLHVACIHVREIDGGTEEQNFLHKRKHIFFFIIFSSSLHLDLMKGSVGWGLPWRRQAGLRRQTKSGLQ